MSDLLKQNIAPAPNVKIMINIGACLDISTGTYIEGRRGEHILNGGLAPLTGVVGIGNNFKSKLLHYMFMTAMIRICDDSTGASYDTEVNMQEPHLKNLMYRLPEMNGIDLIDNGRWVITDKTIYSGNAWYDLKKEWLDNKIKNSKKLEVDTPFWNRERNGPFKMLIPTFDEVDSFTEFETDDVIDMQDKNELGDAGGNTIPMRQGLAKMRFLMEAPRLFCASYDYLMMTAHIGKESTMQNAGPRGQVPVVTLKHLKNGDKIMGVTRKFTFVMHNCWHCYDATPLIDKNTKFAYYPKNSEDKTEYDTDLNVIKIRNLRGKSGATGLGMELIGSQKDGILPSLTEFHNIKENGNYGISGNNTSYSLDLYPEVTLMRTTVRGKIDTDAKLRRALNITSEMFQMDNLWRGDITDVMCTPKELYDDLKAMGYDWEVLYNTRGWWTLSEAGKPPFLSTMDLLRMRKQLYFPYFLNEDKTLKDEYKI